MSMADIESIVREHGEAMDAAGRIVGFELALAAAIKCIGARKDIQADVRASIMGDLCAISSADAALAEVAAPLAKVA